jgi:serine-aspartate repeat-containing protein C/D/E
MKWNHRRKNSITRTARSAAAIRQAAIEPLERRQLLSATVDIRTASGGKTATVTSVGQVVNLDIYVVVSGKTAGSNDGFQSVTGSILGTETVSGSIIGNLASHVTDDYTASGAQDGNSVDLNGDGGLDVGSNNNAYIVGFFYPRAGGIMQDGTVSGDTQTFLVGTATYTVTTLNSGSATDINFRVRDITGGAFEAVWQEDGVGVTDESGSLLVGSPVVISNGVAANAAIAGTVSKSVNNATSGFSGVTVYLDNNNDGSFDSGDTSVTTSSTGTYSFSGLAAGTYYLREVVPSGYTQTSPTSSPTAITLSAGQSVTGKNFTDTAAATGSASISGYVFNDANGDGKWQSTEKAISGAEVFLDTNNNGVLDSGEPTATTNSSGEYTFSGLAAGTYKVQDVVPSGEKLTTVGSYTITLSSTTASTNKNFGNEATGVTGTGSIAGTVDKVVSGSTSGFSGVVVYLDTNDNGSLDAGEPSTTTSSTGTYSFTGLAAGTYYLRESVPSGYSQTSPSSSPTSIALASGQSVTGENFTDTAAVSNGNASISGYVFNDANGDGKWQSTEKAVAGVTLFLDTNKNGVLDSGEPTAVTGSNGEYTFSGLAAGTYIVEEQVPSGEKLTTVGSYTITLSSTTASANKNFGNEATVSGTASISGTIDKTVGGVTSGFSGVVVYLDTNNNGVLDAGEPSTTTSSTGTYSFVGLAAGTYYLRETVPSGYTQTSPSSSPVTIALTAGKAVTGENFTDTAVAAGSGSISGYVFDDTNGDGKWESTEKAVAGVEIFIDSNKNGVVDSGEVTTVTGSNGEYTFAGLAAGTYRIREVVPSGKKLTTVAYYDVTIPAGYNSTSKNFGNE